MWRRITRESLLQATETDLAAIAAEAALDGVCVIRTSLSQQDMAPEDCVGTCNVRPTHRRTALSNRDQFAPHRVSLTGEMRDSGRPGNRSDGRARRSRAGSGRAA